MFPTLHHPHLPLAAAILGMMLLAPARSLAQAPLAVSGNVTDARDGSVVAGAIVVLEEAARTAVTTSDGGFRFDGLAPGTYHVKVTAARFTPARIEITASSASGGPPCGGRPAALLVSSDESFIM